MVVGGVLLPIYALAVATSNLMAFVYVTVVGWEVNGLWFGLLCGILVALLGCTMAIGYFLIPVLIQSVYHRRYGHLLNARDD